MWNALEVAFPELAHSAGGQDSQANEYPDGAPCPSGLRLRVSRARELIPHKRKERKRERERAMPNQPLTKTGAAGRANGLRVAWTIPKPCRKKDREQA